MVATATALYAIGGTSGGTTLATVEQATINADGTIGIFTGGPSLNAWRASSTRVS